MQAGVVSDLMEVSFRTTVDVTSQGTGSAVANSPSGTQHIGREFSRSRESVKVLVQDLLKRERHSMFSPPINIAPQSPLGQCNDCGNPAAAKNL
jgi:hypothetical protein